MPRPPGAFSARLERLAFEGGGFDAGGRGAFPRTRAFGAPTHLLPIFPLELFFGSGAVWLTR
jgi:hypothetical protein